MSLFVRVWARILLAPILVTAVALLVRGYASTGDGFAGGVVAATGVLLQYVAFGQRRVEAILPVVWAGPAAGLGLALALAVTFGPSVLGRAPVSHLPAPGAHVVDVGMLEVHTALLFDAGVFLTVFGGLVSMLHWIAKPNPERAP